MWWHNQSQSPTLVELGVTTTRILQDGVAVSLEGIFVVIKGGVLAVLIQNGSGQQIKRSCVVEEQKPKMKSKFHFEYFWGKIAKFRGGQIWPKVVHKKTKTNTYTQEKPKMSPF